jgi:hypothetical protein
MVVVVADRPLVAVLNRDPAAILVGDRIVDGVHAGSLGLRAMRRRRPFATAWYVTGLHVAS